MRTGPARLEPVYPWIPAAVTFLLYLPTLRYAISLWDDVGYIERNYAVQGVTWASLWRLVTEAHMINWAPLTQLSFVADWVIHGGRAWGFHLQNILYASLASALLYLFLRELTGRPLLALAVSLLHAVHPLQVENVAWVSERKAVLAQIFILGALIAWERYRRAEEGTRFWYWAALLSTLLALLSKAIAVVVPPLLLLLDWRRERLGRRTLVETAPFFILAAVLGAGVTIWTQAKEGIKPEAIRTAADLLYRPLTVFGWYVRKGLFPVGLSCSYWGVTGTPIQAAWGLAWMAIPALLLPWRLPFRDAAFWLGFYLVTLLPVSGVVPISILVADRYAYLPSIALAAGLLGVAATVPRRFWRGALYAVLASILALLTWHREPVWRNTESLWRDVLAKDPHHLQAYTLLTAELLQQERYEEAEQLVDRFFREAVASGDLGYQQQAVFFKAGLDLLEGRKERALVQLRELVKSRPADGMVYATTAELLLELDAEGNREEALRVLEEGLRIAPDTPRLVALLAELLAERDTDAGRRLVDTALDQHPHDPRFYVVRGRFLLRHAQTLDDVLLALKTFERLLQRNPGYVEAHFHIGVALQALGRPSEARARYRTFLDRAPPDHPLVEEARRRLASSTEEPGE